MARSAGLVLGIDIDPYGARVVELRVGAGPSRVTAAGQAPMPDGAFEGDRIADPEAVALVLRDVLRRMGARTRSAVVGLGAHAYTTRVLDVPKVPDPEVRDVVRAELAHYQVPSADTGTFDYVRLQYPDDAAETSSQVLVMAASQRAVDAVREMCLRAGITPVAVEPVLLGLYRACFPAAQDVPSAVCLCVSHSQSEIAIVDGGSIGIYRRVDIGAHDLAAGAELPDRGFDAEAHITTSRPGAAVMTSEATSLAAEVQRSLDLYRREYPRAPRACRMFVAANDARLAPLAGWMSGLLKIDAVPLGAPVPAGARQSLVSELASPGGTRYLGAYGLAMRSASEARHIPALDLAGAGPASAHGGGEARRARRISAAVAAAVLVVSVAWALLLQQRVRTAELRLASMGSELMQKQQMARVAAQIDERQHNLQVGLAAQSLPAPRIVDAVAAGLDPQAGLLEVAITRSGEVSIGVQAPDQASMMRTVDGLRHCTALKGPALQRFRARRVRGAQVIEFRIAAQVADGVRGVAR